MINNNMLKEVETKYVLQGYKVGNFTRLEFLRTFYQIVVIFVYRKTITKINVFSYFFKEYTNSSEKYDIS